MPTRIAPAVSHLLFLALGIALGSLVSTSVRADQSAPSVGAQADAASEIAVLRYFKIKKGSFPEVYRLSVDGVWPYYERAGARIVGMWQMIYPALPGQAARESADYDEAYLLTRYASVEHWQATRDAEIARFGGEGPDLVRMRESIKQRAGLSAESRITVLRGKPAVNGPYFHPPKVK